MLTWLLLAYALLVLGGCALQRKLLYYPHRLPAQTAAREARDNGFIPWTDPQGRLVGWRMTSSLPAQASVLIVHGNAGWAAQRDYIAGPIHELGMLDVYVLEYPGYGSRGGSPSMKSWLGAIEEAVTLLPTNRPTYVVSESIGAGVAAHAARTFPTRVAGLAMFAPFNNLAAVAQRHMPILLPRLTLRDRYNPAEWLREYRGPIQFVLAGRDDIIPPDFGRTLHDGYAGPKRMLEIPHAGHNDIAAQTTEWWREVQAFWRQGTTKGE